MLTFDSQYHWRTEMQIDLKWAIPAALPVGIVLLSRVVWWLAGAAWTPDAAAASAAMSVFIGVVAGLLIAAAMGSEGVKWIVGGKK